MSKTMSTKAEKATSRLQNQLQQAEQDKKAAKEKDKRNELFAAQNVSSEPEIAEAEMTTEQLVKKAQKTHQDTTAVAKNALKVIEDTKQIQAATMAELEDQSKRLHGIDKGLNQMNEDIKYSERLLRYMRRCCCCWMCDACTGADPEDQKKKKWERAVDKGKTGKAVDAAVQQAMSRDEAGTSKGGSPAAKGATPHRDPDIKLTPEFVSTEMAMHGETRKQNEIIDQIGEGLDHLMAGAQSMKTELKEQNKVVDGINARADATSSRVKDMNTKSQLKEFRVKK